MNKKQSVGRPREFNKDKILKNIMNLFWEHGYEGTSLSHIIAATGLKKGSLYAAFGDKHTMYLAAIEKYETAIVESTQLFLSNGEGDPLSRIKEFLNAPMKAVGNTNDRRGCFLCNASSDRAALDLETSKLVKRGFNKLEKGLFDVLLEISPNKNHENLKARARWILATYSGFRVMVRSGMSIDELNSALEDIISVI